MTTFPPGLYESLVADVDLLPDKASYTIMSQPGIPHLRAPIAPGTPAAGAP